eukprot:jgi/Bigna1/144574/aug1.89_g19282
MASKLPKGWPPEIDFKSDCDWTGVCEELQAKLRPKQNNEKRACRSVRIRVIEDENHPAYRQRGLFAAGTIKPRTHIIDYVGKILPESKESQTSDYIIAFTENLSIDAEKHGNESRFINDFRGTGGKQNVKFDTYESQEGTRLGVFSMKEPVRKGEELLVTYGRGFWKARGLLAELSSKHEFKQKNTNENPKEANTNAKRNICSATKQRSNARNQEKMCNKPRKSDSRKKNKKKKKR